MLYVPDFLANAGGVIHIQATREGWDEKRLRAAVLAIGARVRDTLQAAQADGCTPLDAAEAVARARLAHVAAGAGHGNPRSPRDTGVHLQGAALGAAQAGGRTT